MAWMGRFREFGYSGVISSRKFSIVPLPLSFEQLVVLVHCIGVACLVGIWVVGILGYFSGGPLQLTWLRGLLIRCLVHFHVQVSIE